MSHEPRWARTAARAALASSLLAACATVASAPGPTPTPTAADAAISPPMASVVDPGVAAVQVDAGAALVSSAESFRCGRATCHAHTETCCGAGEQGVCVRSSPNDAEQGSVGYLKTQFELCEQAVMAHGGHSLSHIARCDETIDCDSGQVCCEQFLFSGGTLSECTLLPPGGRTPCDYGERCIDAATCRLPGTTCVEGFCIKPVPELRCDGANCDGGLVCCSDPPGCQSTCESYKRIRCTRDADCLAGQRCVMADHGTACARLIVPEAMQPVCTRDGDCPTGCPGAPKMRARCLQSAISWLKTCQCP